MQQRRGDFWRGFFWGSVIGASAGLLLAPAPGYETRARLTNQVSSARRQASDVTSQAQVTSAEAAQKSRSYIADIRSRLAQSIQVGKQAAAVKREELRAEVESVTEPKPSM